MTTTALEARVERLLTSLAGVVSVRAIAGPDGHLREIHVLATAELHPKQVVRNVESALSAGLGLEVDRRIVSVAQVRDTDFAAGPEPSAPLSGTPAPAASPAAPGSTGDIAERLTLVRFDTWMQDGRVAHCRVVVRRASDEFTGAGEGAATPQGRAEAAARALFAALAATRGREDVALEDTTVVETIGRGFVLVAARALSGRRSIPLTGVAAVRRSPEEAAILASLQAANRWAELPV